jgi:hypothetical protein
MEVSNSGNSSLDQSKQADAMSYLIAQRSEQAFPFRVIHDRQRIIEMPVYEFRFRKTGAFRPRTITQRDHEVEAVTQNVVRGFCSPSSKINTDLLHHLDRKRMSLASLRSSAACGGNEIIGEDSRIFFPLTRINFPSARVGVVYRF